MIGGLHVLAKRAYRALPPGLRVRLFGLATFLDGRLNPDLIARRRWIRRDYQRFGWQQRENIFLSIARYCHINRPMHGYYFEFGSHGANTMRLAWKHFRHLFDWTFVAFDSFEGLPEVTEMDRTEIFEKGHLATSEEEFIRVVTGAGMPRERLLTVKGFYEDTLTPEVKAQLLPNKAAVVYVDCDLHSSTAVVLEFIRDFLQRGTVVVFDDWNCYHADPCKGERRAWREFLRKHGRLRFEELYSTGEAKVFVFIGERDSDEVPARQSATG